MSTTEEMKSPASQEVTFTAFVLSLSTAALQHLGVKVVEEAEDTCLNLALARQTIDILEMLEKKTQGNLSEQENKLISNVLYDLRMRFVQASRGVEC